MMDSNQTYNKLIQLMQILKTTLIINDGSEKNMKN